MAEEWMKDPTLAEIPKDKLDFLQKLVFESQKLTQKEMMPFLMSLAARAKSSSISFTSDEMSKIIAVLEKHSTPAELAKMNQVMKLMKFRS